MIINFQLPLWESGIGVYPGYLHQRSSLCTELISAHFLPVIRLASFPNWLIPEKNILLQASLVKHPEKCKDQ
jgi:hypothetical protein